MYKTIPKRDLNKIRNRLPRRWADHISSALGKSPSLVQKVMLGLRKNREIVTYAIEIANLSNEDRSLLLQKLEDEPN